MLTAQLFDTPVFYPHVFLSGLGICAGLIMAIGAQNAHVLRIGIKRQHVALTIVACIAIDAVLIGLGVGGMGSLIQASPTLLMIARWGGFLFLLWYGLRSWLALIRSNALRVDAAGPALGARQALLAVVALSLLNPHVYLDTVVLLGSLGGSYPAPQRASFAAGAIATSAIWFCALGFGARSLSRVLQRPWVWKCIEALTGLTMLVMAGGLALGK